jgi:uncharacterized protein YbbK (DUF523 family)
VRWARPDPQAGPPVETIAPVEPFKARCGEVAEVCPEIAKNLPLPNKSLHQTVSKALGRKSRYRPHETGRGSALTV